MMTITEKPSVSHWKDVSLFLVEIFYPRKEINYAFKLYFFEVLNVRQIKMRRGISSVLPDSLK